MSALTRDLFGATAAGEEVAVFTLWSASPAARGPSAGGYGRRTQSRLYPFFASRSSSHCSRAGVNSRAASHVAPMPARASWPIVSIPG